MTMAQPAAPPQQSTTERTQGTHHRGAGDRQRFMLRRLTMQLALTPDQQEHIKAIFKETNQQSQALTAQFRQERRSLMTAVKNDSEPQIDQITQQNAALNTQIEAIHLKQMAKIRSILTADQKVKFDQRIDRALGDWRAARESARHARS
jgi:Spy/CpxP family protein refolding chaperone